MTVSADSFPCGHELDHCREPKIFSTSHTLSPAHPTSIYAMEIQYTAIKSSIYYFLSVSYDRNYHQFLNQLSELGILLASQNIHTTPCETLWVESLLLTTYLFTISVNYFQGEEEATTGIMFAFAGYTKRCVAKAFENGIVLHYIQLHIKGISLYIWTIYLVKVSKKSDFILSLLCNTVT